MSKRCPDCGGFLISYDKGGHKCKTSTAGPTSTTSAAGDSSVDKLMTIKSDIQRRKANKESEEARKALVRLESFSFPMPSDLELTDEERTLAVNLQDFGMPSVEEYLKTLDNTKAFAEYLLHILSDSNSGAIALAHSLDLSNTQRIVAESNDQPIEHRRAFAQYLLTKCDYCRDCPEFHLRINDEQEERRLEFTFHHPGPLSPYNNAWECCERVGVDAPGCKKGVPMYHPGKFYLGWSCCQQMRIAAGCIVCPPEGVPIRRNSSCAETIVPSSIFTKLVSNQDSASRASP